MIDKTLEDYTSKDLLNLLNENVDAIVMVDSKLNKYRTITSKGIFESLLEETGEYYDFIQKLWFHLENSNEEITGDYKAFIAYYGEFKGKYSRRLNIKLEGDDTPHVVQMNVYPIKGTNKYLFAMDELASDEFVEEFMTSRKVNTIQNTFLFSMYVDLIMDSIKSISVTEVSKSTVNASIKYSQWRLMTVNMIWPEDQKQFLAITDPDYLKENLGHGRTTSFDCMMKNLEGIYIWVKLIFSRADTGNDDDFKFVFMVQDINENTMELMDTLKKYEGLAHKDPLTSLFNHGGIETEIHNAIDVYKKGGDPVSLMMIDLDHFKDVNDTYGHSVGDSTLRAFADILRASTDGKRATVGRWGGEEFVVLLRGLSGDQPFYFAEDLRHRVEVADFGEAGHITCSIGVSNLNPEDSFDKVFNRMDKAMYSSKKAGRNRVTEV